VQAGTLALATGGDQSKDAAVVEGLLEDMAGLTHAGRNVSGAGHEDTCRRLRQARGAYQDPRAGARQIEIVGLAGLTVNCGSSMPEGGTNTFQCCNANLQYFSCTQEAPDCAGCARDATKDSMCAVAE
jgi:hypothetical protein